MAVYNVMVSVVANVAAPNPYAAYKRLADAVEAAGFSLDYSRATGEAGTTFEAEDGTEPHPRFAEQRS